MKTSQTKKNSSSEEVSKKIYYFVLVLIIFQLIFGYKYQQSEAIKNYKFQNFQDDLLFLIVWTLGLWILRSQSLIYLNNGIQKMQYKDLNLKEDSTEYKQIKKQSKAIFEITFFLFSIILTHLCVYDQDFYPSSFLGTHPEASVRNCFKNYPDMTSILPNVRFIYLIQCAYRLMCYLNSYFYETNDDKHYEFMLHHLIAFLLIFFSYLVYYMKVGLLVMLACDISDVILFPIRQLRKYMGKNLQMAVYIMNLISWFYFRIWFFYTQPISVIFDITYNGYQDLEGFNYEIWIQQQFISYSIVFLLCILQSMNIFWIWTHIQKKKYHNY